PQQFYEKNISVILSNRDRDIDRGRTLPWRFDAGGPKERGKQNIALTFREHVEEPRDGSAEREGQILYERRGPGRDDGSRDGPDGPAKKQERRREKDRRHDGGRSYQGEQRTDGDREEERRRSLERKAENEASERRELRQGIHRRDGEGPRRGSRGVSGRSEKWQRRRRESVRFENLGGDQEAPRHGEGRAGEAQVTRSRISRKSRPAPAVSIAGRKSWGSIPVTRRRSVRPGI